MSGKLAALTPGLFCNQNIAACGTNHGWGCGACFEVRCTGVQPPKVATVAETCTGTTAIVWGTDQCIGGTHCSKQYHFDLHREIYKVIAVNGDNESPLFVDFRPIDCPAPNAVQVSLRIEGHRDWVRITPVDVTGKGFLSKVEIMMDAPGTASNKRTPPANTWAKLDEGQGAYFGIGTGGVEYDRIGYGPYHLRLTCENGRQITYDLPSSLTDMTDGVYTVPDNCHQSGNTVTTTPSSGTTISGGTTMQGSGTTISTNSSATSTVGLVSLALGHAPSMLAAAWLLIA